jgi:hypothetical protein
LALYSKSLCAYEQQKRAEVSLFLYLDVSGKQVRTTQAVPQQNMANALIVIHFTLFVF